MDQKKIGLFISRQRKEKGLTQKQLGEQLGVGDKSVSKWERGICLPDVSLFLSLCKVLEVDLNELFLGEKIKEEEKIEKMEEAILPVIKKYQRINKIKNILIILFFITLRLIMIQWSMKFYMAEIENPYLYLISLLYVPSYHLIYKKKKQGYALAWLTYFILSAIYLAIESIHPEYLFNSYSLDFWLNSFITLLALINGEIMEIKNTVDKLYG